MLTSTIGVGPGTAGGRREVSRLCLGTMYFGTRTDEATSFAVLDRFQAAGGTFLDTANCYNQWVVPKDGGESEELIGRWLRSRGAADRMVVATKIGCRTTVPGEPTPDRFEGLAAPTVRKAAQESLRRLGLDQVGLLYAHYDDRSVPLEETVGAFAELAAEGAAAVLGVSNVATWRVEQARRIAAEHGWARYTCVQQAGSYLWPRPARGQLHVVTDELVDYAGEHDDVTIMAYTPLLAGFYADRARSMPGGYDHASSRARLAVLDEVAADLGATVGQVVLAWLMTGPVPIVPVIGASTVAQVEEALGAVELVLPAEVRERLDAA